MKSSLWHSRLPDRVPDPVFEALNASLPVDARLFREEIAATKAHACALRRAGVYTNAECETVRAALCRIEEEIASGTLPREGFEDVHSLIEHRLTELAGDAGAKIQTSRSRNEQTVTAQRLFLKDALAGVTSSIQELQAALLQQAEAHVDTLMPGFTHARPAQPVRFAHYLCSFFFGLDRDRGRLLDAGKRLDASPAGAGALAGPSFPLDREALAADLGFPAPTENALDTVSDRDAALETLAGLSILMVRLSRLAEDLIHWSSPAYGFVDLGETYCTSSSVMPQKKNPDALELVRGKTGRVAGALVSLLVTCKGLPTGYQKDLQEDKEPLFDALDTARACLKVCAGQVRDLAPDAEAMAAAVTEACLATDRADALVETGVPFRKAFAEVAAQYAVQGKRNGRGKPKGRNGRTTITAESSVERRNATGGTGRKAVLRQIETARARLRA